GNLGVTSKSRSGQKGQEGCEAAINGPTSSGSRKPQPMSHPSAATRQRVPAHFAGNGRFLEVGAWIKVAGNFLASFKANRHIFLLLLCALCPFPHDTSDRPDLLVLFMMQRRDFFFEV